jgi:CDGSH-type Zn-finger protein
MDQDFDQKACRRARNFFTFEEIFLLPSSRRNLMGTKITPKENSSLRIEGDFQIVDMQGNVYDLGGRTRISLCRCGQSKNKPFCDSSHRDAGFKAESRAFALPPIARNQ